MTNERTFHVVVTFDSGVKASVWTHGQPIFPASMWDPETLSCIGDPDGPCIEFHGRDLSELSVVRSREAEGFTAVPSGNR